MSRDEYVELRGVYDALGAAQSVVAGLLTRHAMGMLDEAEDHEQGLVERGGVGVGLVGKKRRAPSAGDLVLKERPSDVERCFCEWARAKGSEVVVLLDTRRKKLGEAIAVYGFETVFAAMSGWLNDPWEGRKEQSDLLVLLRPTNVERFAEMKRSGPAVRVEGLSRGLRQVLEITAHGDAA